MKLGAQDVSRAPILSSVFLFRMSNMFRGDMRVIDIIMSSRQHFSVTFLY
jgi:hypothetical protein